MHMKCVACTHHHPEAVFLKDAYFILHIPGRQSKSIPYSACTGTVWLCILQELAPGRLQLPHFKTFGTLGNEKYNERRCELFSYYPNLTKNRKTFHF